MDGASNDERLLSREAPLHVPRLWRLTSMRSLENPCTVPRLRWGIHLRTWWRAGFHGLVALLATVKERLLY